MSGSAVASPLHSLCSTATNPHRPDIVIWMELPDHLVVGQAVLSPGDNHGTVARTLRNADHNLADEVRAEVAGTIPVTVAPTPELDDLLQILVASMPPPGEDEPNFAHGRVSPDTVEIRFTASDSLFAITLWSLVDDNQIPAWTSPHSASTAPACRSSDSSARAAAC